MPRASDGAYFSQRDDGSRFAEWADVSPEGFFRELDNAGVRTAVSVAYNNQGLVLGRRRLPGRTTSNDEQARLQREYPGRFVGVAAIDVGGEAHDPHDEMNRCVSELGLRLFGIEPGRATLFADHPADRRLYPFYEQAQAMGVPLMLQTSGFYGGKNLDYAHPRHIDQLAEDFQDLHVICGHGCYPFVRELIAVTVRRDNVYPSPDLYVFAPSRREWVYAVNKGLITDKFLYASGYPLCGSLVRFVSRFLLLGWEPGALDRILYRNAIMAMKLEEDPSFSTLLSRPRHFSTSSVVRAGVRLLVHETRGLISRRKMSNIGPEA
jgi:predicted TIM-barrel fold metal-dependent hydrolase